MKNHDPLVDSPNLESPKLGIDAKSPEGIETNRTAPISTGNIARRRMRVAGRMLGSLLLGGVAILGSILIFRKGARLADRRDVRSREFVAGDRVDHGRGCAAAARGTATWGLLRAGGLVPMRCLRSPDRPPLRPNKGMQRTRFARR